MASPNKLEHSQVSGEVTLNIPQAKARRPSRGRKCRKAGTPDSCNPRAAVVKRVMRRKQLLGSDKVSITDLSKPAEDHYEGQSMGATALPDERSPMIPPTPLVNAQVSDIDSSALDLVEDKGRSYPTSLSTNANDRTTNESEIHDFEVSRVSHLGAEQSEETKQLIAHPDNNEADVNAKIDGPRRSQTPVEDIRVMTKLGKRRTRQTGRDAGNTITRNLEEGNGPRKSRKTTNDDIQAGESANGCHSKVTLSGCATNEIKLEITAPPDAFDEIADQSKENRFCKHKITKTKSTSVTMKKGSHTTFTQGKPRPKPRLVISAKHRDPVPTEETTRVVPANDPPPITNEPVTTTYVHNPIPTPIAQTQSIDSVQLHDAGADKKSEDHVAALKQGHISLPSDFNNLFTATDVQHEELSHNAGDLSLHPRGSTCPGEVPLDEAAPFGTLLGLGQSDATLTSLMDEFIDSQALTECLVPMKAGDDVNESPEPEQKKVIANGLPACQSPILRKSAEGNIHPDKLDAATAAIINNAHKPPTLPSAPPRKRLSVTFASPIERVMSPSIHSSVDNTQDRMDYSPIEMRLQQRRARQGSWNLDGKKSSSSYDDPLSPLPEPTTSTTPHKMTRPLFPSNSSSHMRKDGASCESG
ncbi:hypothetical protein SCLCIDRAFT_692525 [Scleroderma citrinum Foug A]|uniref:Uncharacterized protein n=1 Tax=Scleroderma citrinum Foug A TaxID=1036808 RepID=A0A0C3D4J0_9AGAM|nr:hypothetical protein SCLCIDRAFT_692525 [Scleroderma citrinum Foug A]